MRDQILEDHRRFSTELLRIFFDTEDIRDMEDWLHRKTRERSTHAATADGFIEIMLRLEAIAAEILDRFTRDWLGMLARQG